MLQKIYRLGAFSVVALVGQAIGLAGAAMAQEADADLAKKLSNPLRR
ncbi:Uncharacterised protein [Agrobacterium tumefaciens]|nr:Uncharacterised protein [Agrobacterium tumefaciens]